jgi:hypothetical protein
MFNTYITKEAPRYPQTITKHEHRAPTDESVRLLKEMEMKAEEKMIEAVRLENNVFKAVYRVFDNPRDMNYKCVVQYSLNNRDFTGEFTMNHREVYPAKEIAFRVLEKIQDMMARHLTAEFMLETISTWRKS